MMYVKMGGYVKVYTYGCLLMPCASSVHALTWPDFSEPLL